MFQWNPISLQPILSMPSISSIQNNNRSTKTIWMQSFSDHALWIFVDRKVGMGKTFLVNTICNKVRSMRPASTLNFIGKQIFPGWSLHTIVIKINDIYWLLQNFSLDHGLVKNVQVIVSKLNNHLITAHLIQDIDKQTYSKELLISRIFFSYTFSSSHTLLQRQYPFTPGYATTFNSCQSLNLDAVIVINLTYPVFLHRELYTALPWIWNCSNAVVHL
jgi:hypothetical protein